MPRRTSPRARSRASPATPSPSRQGQVARHLHDRRQRPDHHRRAAAVHRGQLQGLQLLALRSWSARPMPSRAPTSLRSAGRPHRARGRIAMTAPVLELRGITKRFGAVEVLTDVDLRCTPGRVHALAGENGAGKSTLVKILGGIHQPDGGRILRTASRITLRGRRSTAAARASPSSTSTRRCFPTSRSPRTSSSAASRDRGGRIDWARDAQPRRGAAAATATSNRRRLPVKHARASPSARRSRSPARSSIDARVLVMDEPTSAISGSEVDRLFEIVAHAEASRAWPSCSSAISSTRS